MLSIPGEDDGAPSVLRALARVLDRYRLEGGGWRIAERLPRPLAGGGRAY